VFGTDVIIPGMLAATVVQSPVFGGRPAEIDSASAKAIAGVRDVIEITGGVAVVADTLWAALQGREALKVAWQGGETAGLSDALAFDGMRDAARHRGRVDRNQGDVDRALDQAATVIEAEYELPYLAHAAMEPMNCNARVADGRCEIWVPTQSPTLAQRAAAKAAGVQTKAAEVHTTFLGGGFGRRAGGIGDVVTPGGGDREGGRAASPACLVACGGPAA
jgi:isoquinoline 1-oxidoreductase beta subunit